MKILRKTIPRKNNNNCTNIIIIFFVDLRSLILNSSKSYPHAIIHFFLASSSCGKVKYLISSFCFVFFFLQNFTEQVGIFTKQQIRQFWKYTTQPKMLLLQNVCFCIQFTIVYAAAAAGRMHKL